MTYPTLHTPRVPPELVEMLRDCVQRRGANGAAKLYGISRQTVAGVLGGLPVTNGTIAILRLAFQRREAA
jgi:hypothetical protein